MKLFRRSVTIRPVDPLGDGLGDFIERARSGPDRIELTESFDSSELVRQWEIIHRDFVKDTTRISRS